MKTPQNKYFKEQNQQFYTCVLNFVTFLCRPLQNVEVKFQIQGFVENVNTRRRIFHSGAISIEVERVKVMLISSTNKIELLFSSDVFVGVAFVAA